jgi:hypothetical protein
MARRLRIQYPGAIYHAMNRGHRREAIFVGKWGIPAESLAGREQFAGRMEARRRAEGTGYYEPHGWCLGSEEFREELLLAVNQAASPSHTGEAIRLPAEAKARRMIQRELRALGWPPEELKGRRGESSNCKASAAQDKDDLGMDRAEPPHGRRGPYVLPALSEGGGQAGLWRHKSGADDNG